MGDVDVRAAARIGRVTHIRARETAVPDAGRLRIRPLRAMDRLNLMALDRRLSDRSVYRRFFSIDRHQADVYATHLLVHDPRSHHALVALLDGSLIGIASYERIDDRCAEIAMLVDDVAQRRGIGSQLMRALMADARVAGFRTLIADVLGENTAMVQLIRDTGLDTTWSYEGSVRRARVELLDPVSERSTHRSGAHLGGLGHR